MTKSLLQRNSGKVYFGQESIPCVQENKPQTPAGENADPENAPAVSAHREHDTGVGRRKAEKIIVSPDELNPTLPPEPMPDADSAEAEEAEDA